MLLVLSLTLASCILTVIANDCGSECKLHETCCPASTPGDFRCCPYENGVCCPDHVHCCQRNTVCNVETGTCDEPDIHLQNLDKLEKRQGPPAEERPNYRNRCDERSYCPSESTCCVSVDGSYGCCPFEDGVCCSDHVHCCPRDTVCDKETGTCDKPGIHLQKLDKLEKRQGVPAEERPYYQNRCDDSSYCPYDSTCCLSVDGSYGCCPFLYATCCPDEIHCCPHDTQCDATSEHCIGEDVSFPSMAKNPVFAIDDESLL